MAVDCLGGAARMSRRHRSLSTSLEPLAMMFAFLLVSSHLIAMSIGLPVPPGGQSSNNTNTSIITNATNTSHITNASNESTNATSLCGEVRCDPGQECTVNEKNDTVCINVSDHKKEDLCSNDPVCGNDGITYKNDCEMRKKGVGLKSYGPCLSCQTIKDRHVPFDIHKHFNKALPFLSSCNEVTINDALSSEFFDPKCSEEDPDVFLVDQSLDVYDVCAYYWCSTPDGVVIEDTFQRKKTDCISRTSCVVGDRVYQDGQVFKPDCGICACLDGKIDCIDEFCGVSGNLTDKQLDILKNDIYHIFFFQFQLSRHTLIDLHYIRDNPINTDSEDNACLVLDWKFKYYDVSGSGELLANEQHKFIEEIEEYINFKEFEDQMIEEMDTNHDSLIQFDEWFKYFTDYATEGNSGGSVEWTCKQSVKTR